MRLVYLGSPEAAVPPLRALVDAGFEVALVVSQPDRKRGRGAALLPSPVKAAATELGIPLTDRVDDLLDAGADLGVVVAFGKLIKPHVLDRVPMVNVHFSLLPRWRGAAPVERAILAGDTETGVCIMQLEEGLDTGPVYAVEHTAIGDHETAAELRDRLVDIGTKLLVQTLRDGLGTPVPQEGEPTYAAKLEPEDFELDWEQPAEQLLRVVRLGRAWTTFRGKRLKILHAVASPDGGIEPTLVQPEGKAPMDAAAWRNGVRRRVGERFGE